MVDAACKQRRQVPDIPVGSAHSDVRNEAARMVYLYLVSIDATREPAVKIYLEKCVRHTPPRRFPIALNCPISFAVTTPFLEAFAPGLPISAVHLNTCFRVSSARCRSYINKSSSVEVISCSSATYIFSLRARDHVYIIVFNYFFSAPSIQNVQRPQLWLIGQAFGGIAVGDRGLTGVGVRHFLFNWGFSYICTVAPNMYGTLISCPHVLTCGLQNTLRVGGG